MDWAWKNYEVLPTLIIFHPNGFLLEHFEEKGLCPVFAYGAGKADTRIR
jgi:hypothetical protein